MKALLLIVISSTPLLAQASDYLRCRSMTDPQARLACYDQLADAEIKQPPTARAVASTPSPAAAAAQFGLESRQPAAQLEGVDSTIKGDFEGWGPQTIFRLENGQQWQVIDGSSAVLYLKNPKVKIRRGALTSYVFELEGSNKTARVRRLAD